MNELLEKSIMIACKAHSGQVDKAGEPYILHPIRVMMKVKSIEEKIIAILHDVIEDSDLTKENLLSEGFPVEIIEAVALLSISPQISYEKYIENIKGNHLAVKIKLADLEDNMNISRLKVITVKDEERLKKYKLAYSFLTR